MKTIRIWSTVAPLATTLLTGCKKDNFDPPSTWMTGRLVHNGAPVYMDGSPSDANDEIIGVLGADIQLEEIIRRAESLEAEVPNSEEE